uniref:Secreted protein n=1 Tax=Steinernema glaseri TaxID=37863 RepID=A0A1I7YER8_9BILA
MTPSFFHCLLLFTSVSIAMSQYLYGRQAAMVDSRNVQPQPQGILAPQPIQLLPTLLQGIPNAPALAAARVARVAPPE